MFHINIREIEEADHPLLPEFLYHAIFVPPDSILSPKQIIYEPNIFIYIENFGGKDDCGVVAECNDKVLGIAWTRIIPAYGHIDYETPELAISVLPEERNQGIGTMLLDNLFELLRIRGYKRTSLSVQKENPAARLYQRMGYEILRDNSEDYIMVKRLTDNK